MQAENSGEMNCGSFVNILFFIFKLNNLKFIKFILNNKFLYFIVIIYLHLYYHFHNNHMYYGKVNPHFINKNFGLRVLSDLSKILCYKHRR